MRLKPFEVLLLVIPVAVVAILLPHLPDKLPFMLNIYGEWVYLNKEYYMLASFVPFIIYGFYKINKNLGKRNRRK